MEDRVFYHCLRIGKGAITFAIKLLGIKPGVPTRWVQYSYSFCSPKDHFNKRKGRDIATARLMHPNQKRVSGFEVPTRDRCKKPIHILVLEHFENALLARSESMVVTWIVPCFWLSKIVNRLKKRDDGKLLTVFEGMPIEAGEHLNGVMKTRKWRDAPKVDKTATVG